MEHPMETKETRLEPNEGDKFYAKCDCIVDGRERNVPIKALDVIEMMRVAPNLFTSHLIRIIKKDGGSVSESFFIARENFDALPLALEKRKGPVSPKNPLSLERAEQLLKPGECAMREELASETSIRELMLAARERVRAKGGPQIILDAAEKEALLKASVDPPTD